MSSVAMALIGQKCNLEAYVRLGKKLRFNYPIFGTKIVMVVVSFFQIILRNHISHAENHILHLSLDYLSFSLVFELGFDTGRFLNSY